jgi:hypothetical protein
VHSLGVAEEFEPRLTRIKLNPGDLVLVASTQIADVVPDQHIERIMARGSDEALPELYLLCRDRANMALVLLSCFEPEPEQVPDSRRAMVTLTDTAAPGDDELASAQGCWSGRPPEPAQNRPRRRSLRARSTASCCRRGPIQEQVREITESTAPPPSTNVRLRGDSAAPRYRRTTGAFAVPQFQVPRLAVFAVIALAILGALAYWQLPGSVRQSREDKFTALVAEARRRTPARRRPMTPP